MLVVNTLTSSRADEWQYKVMNFLHTDEFRCSWLSWLNAYLHEATDRRDRSRDRSRRRSHGVNIVWCDRQACRQTKSLPAGHMFCSLELMGEVSLRLMLVVYAPDWNRFLQPIPKYTEEAGFRKIQKSLFLLCRWELRWLTAKLT